MKNIFLLLWALLISVTTYANKYGLLVQVYGGDYTEVTEENVSDLFGDGIYCYHPETKTLDIKGNDFAYGRAIVNNSVDSLIINVEKDCTLELFFVLEANTIFKGNGSLTLQGDFGINIVRSGVSVVFDHIDMRIMTYYCGFCNTVYDNDAHQDTGTQLTIISSNVESTIDNEWALIVDKLTLIDCEIVEPQNAIMSEGFLSMDYGNGEIWPVTHFKIVNQAAGIHSANKEPLRKSTLYDLQGRRVENPKQGEIYIQKGKKVKK